ncbi:hypothetical protein PVAND_014500 [Polypedilum vanderplanki]|uniref:Gustatory receptor n=1 Tax=Polypedilum vanderplanki TaxID=319348 RepID=A0A9J6B9C5_POLVA|nr:hypothetical protein PVAND_014500 [Polypedilum vanderplanki]
MVKIALSFVIFCIVSMSITTIAVRIIFEGIEEEKNPNETILLGISVMLMYFSLETIVIFYIIIVLAIKIRFRILVQVLSTKRIQNFSLISKLHILLTEIIENVNLMLSTCLAPFFFFNLTSVIFATFEVYLSIVNLNQGKSDWQLTVYTATWSTFMLIYMFGIVISSETTLKCENNLEKVSLMLMKNENDNIIRKNIWIFVQQFKHTKKDFNCGLFKFNWKFVMFFLGDVVANLVILIQFDVKSDVKN